MLHTDICPICGIKLIEVRPVDARGENIEFEGTINFHKPDCPIAKAMTEELFKTLKKYYQISAMESDSDRHYLGEK